jgi:hypothetical protein
VQFFIEEVDGRHSFFRPSNFSTLVPHDFELF